MIADPALIVERTLVMSATILAFGFLSIGGLWLWRRQTIAAQKATPIDHSSEIGGELVSEAVRGQISTIRAMLDQAHLSKTSEAIFWRALIEKYIAAVRPDLRQTPKLETLAEELRNAPSSQS